MSDKGKLEEVTLKEWEDIFRLSPKDIWKIHWKHAQIKTTSPEFRDIAKFQALRLEPTIHDFHISQDILEYAKAEKLDAIAIEAIKNWNLMGSFSRVKDDKQTGTYLYNRGKLVEAAYVFEDGTRVRIFHNLFYNEKRKAIALRGQEFYNSLSRYARHILSESQTLDSGLLQEYLAKLNPLKPLNHTRYTVNNIFLEGEDLKDHLKDKDEKYRLEKLEEVTAIDIIMSVFADKFKRTKRGKKLYGKKMFKPSDYKLEIFKGILMHADKGWFEALRYKGLIDSRGNILRKSTFNILMRKDNEQARVLDLLGANDYRRGDTFFTTGDSNLGNTMINGGYTTIDFEKSREDEIFAGLVKRYLEGGVYELSDAKVEKVFLPKMFKVYNAAREAAGKLNDTVYRGDSWKEISRKVDNRTNKVCATSWGEFLKRFNFHKKKHLLRLCRRYKHYEENDPEPEKMRLRKEVFYHMLVDQLKKEGKVTGIEDKKLAYLNRLFKPEVNREALERNVNYVFKDENPTYFSMTDVNVLQMVDRQKAEDIFNRQIADIKRARRAKKGKWFGGIAAVVLAVAGSIFGGYMAHRASNKAAEMETKYEETRHDLSMAQKLRIIRVYQNKGEERDNWEVWGVKEIRAWKEKFGNEELAYMAFLDYPTLYEVMREAGLKDVDSITGYLIDSKTEQDPEKSERYSALWKAFVDTRYLVDNFARCGNVHCTPDEYALGTIKKEMQEVDAAYKEFKRRKLSGSFAVHLARKKREADKEYLRTINSQ